MLKKNKIMKIILKKSNKNYIQLNTIFSKFYKILLKKKMMKKLYKNNLKFKKKLNPKSQIFTHRHKSSSNN